ncbi:MAG: SOS response-associated peptidase [Clostridiaceae bacterium]
MCGRFQLEFSIEEMDRYYSLIGVLDDKMGQSSSSKLSPTDLQEVKGVRYPSNPSLIIKEDSLGILPWGFPFNNKLIINARGETLFEKRMYSTVALTQRCLIPASCFFEWKDKIKYNIAPQKGRLFSMAGIYKSFLNDDGSLEERYVIITTSANEEMSKIHNRMPVIIPENMEKTYLSSRTPQEEIIDLLVPYSKELSIISKEPPVQQLSLF